MLPMAIPSEETPLLLNLVHEAEQTKHEAVYDRFGWERKIVITAFVCCCGLLPLFVSGSFMPVIPDIAKDLCTSGPAVSFSISLSIFAASIGGLSSASYSTFYGRRPIYLISLPLCAIGSFGVAMSKTIPQLYAMRVVQSLGASPAMSVGAGTIGDIFKLDERGTAMGIFYAAILIGPPLAPFAGGIAAHYFSWRIMQLAIGMVALIVSISMFFFFPETSHPGKRGVDQWRQENPERPLKLKWINPFGTLRLLKNPNILAVSLGTFGVLLTDYVLLTPLAYTIAARYGITNQALIGLLYMPIGLGNFIGAPLAGHMSDHIVIKSRAKRGGIWYPEDRLRTTLIGSGVLVPLSILFSGLITQFVPQKWGLVANMVCLFINGLGVDIVTCPTAAYTVDIMQSRSAEGMAAANGLCSAMTAVAISVILPLIDHIGVAATNSISALLAWVSFGVYWYMIRYGDQMRAWVDVEDSMK